MQSLLYFISRFVLALTILLEDDKTLEKRVCQAYHSHDCR